jgi:lipopolysaccharide export system protein LptA
MPKVFLCLIVFVLSLSFSTIYAQNGDRIEIVEPAPEYLEGVVLKGKQIRKLIGHVNLRQNNTTIACDSAYQNISDNSLEAFGNVHIVQGDTINLTGDRATYAGGSKMAKAFGNVVLTDRQKTITTEQLDYDMKTSTAFYPDKGKIVDDQNTLTSKRGYYNTKTKIFAFRKDVEVVSPESRVYSDSLQYDSNTKKVFFESFTKIVNKDGTLTAKSGEYDTQKQTSIFYGRSSVQDEKYILTGNKLFYDKKNDTGVAEGEVELFAKEDKTTIYGDIGQYNGKTGVSKVYGRPLMKSIADQDTFYLTADTLVSVNNKLKGEKRTFAFPKAKIFKSDLQGKCDSLVYNLADSTIYFFRDPVMWNKENQLLADTIYIQLNNRKIDKLFMRTNAFVISQDTLNNFNQVKGRNMVAQFKDSQIQQVNVNGNGESLYFALDDKKKDITGMNRIECGKMTLRFVKNKASQKNELNNIAFLTKPDAIFYPPHEIETPARKLKGFRWREKEKPTREQVLLRK